jgi:transposase-like protein
MERRKFTREFKLEAVRLIKERGVAYAQASLDLGVHQSQLRGWVKALAGDPQHARVKRIVVKQGRRLSLQMHHHRAEHWVVVRGTAGDDGSRRSG